MIDPIDPNEWEVLAEGYKAISPKPFHMSDCATSNAPAMKPGPCNCEAPRMGWNIAAWPKDVWCVWTKTGRRPKFFYYSREEAEKQAQILASKNPERSFIVMQLMSKFRVEPTQGMPLREDPSGAEAEGWQPDPEGGAPE